jgi:hypothetical protein
MGFLDGLVKNLVDIVPEAGNPELKAYKAQNELKELAAKEDKIFARLGRQVYADGGSEKYPDIKAELDVLTFSKREVEERVKVAKGEVEEKKQAEDAVRCPQCGIVNAQGSTFCQDCGTRLGQTKRFCPQCGIEIAQGVRFCNECGTKIEE